MFLNPYLSLLAKSGFLKGRRSYYVFSHKVVQRENSINLCETTLRSLKIDWGSPCFPILPFERANDMGTGSMFRQGSVPAGTVLIPKGRGWGGLNTEPLEPLWAFF